MIYEKGIWAFGNIINLSFGIKHQSITNSPIQEKHLQYSWVWVQMYDVILLILM